MASPLIHFEASGRMRRIVSGLLLLVGANLFSQAPKVENVWFEQRTDGTLLVDIYYDLTAAGGIAPEISLAASDDNGVTWDLTCESLSGDIGDNIPPGANKHIVWNFYADQPNRSGSDYRFRITADQEICGATITEDFILTEDLDCRNMQDGAIKIIADDVTLDMGGHTLSGGWRQENVAGIFIQNSNRITIRNGIVDHGFAWGIGIDHSDSVTIEDMVIRDLQFADGDTFVMGVATGESHGVIVRDCQFEYLDVHHKESVVFGNNSTFTVDNIEVKGGSVGVNISGMDISSTGTVTNSRFYVGRLCGVLVHQTTDAVIKNNLFEGCGGVYVDPYLPGLISGLVIEQNLIKDGTESAGVHLRGGTFTTIRSNEILNNYQGIILDKSIECYHYGYEDENCFFSTDNLIENNIVLGNYIDLEHHDSCSGNRWINNTYETAIGMEIYQVGPATAKDGLAEVDSLAKSLITDAELIEVAAAEVDTFGQHYTWIYNYRSESRQQYYQFWYHDGRPIFRDTIYNPWFDHSNPIIDPWIDSDSAIVIADAMGGKDFRSQHELLSIEMGMLNTHWLYWGIHYIAADTAFSVEFDALLK